jgi:RNA polymerase sigma-70 factor (family 1)
VAAEKHIDEAKMLLLLSEGSEVAFIQLFDKYEGKVFRTAQKMLGSREEAKEAVQDIFLNIWRLREDMGSVLNFNAYLNASVRNYVYDIFRDRKQWLRASEELAFTRNFDNSTERQLQEKEYQRLLTDAINALSETQKEVFRLSREEGLSHEAIGVRLNLTTLAVKAHMKRALGNIRQHLEPYLSAGAILVVTALF